MKYDADIVSDGFIDFITKNVFTEPKFIRTEKSNKDWIEINRTIQPREILILQQKSEQTDKLCNLI